MKARADFLRAAKGRRAHGRAMSVQILRRGEDADAEPRFGLTVTRKVGGAVERNRIKRRLRAVLMTQDLQPQAGHDYVIVARRDALSLPFPALAAELARALRPARDGDRRAREATRSGAPAVMKTPHGSRI
ncbi:MAG TPA: ribonuclease P protein component [Lichenihabitans sp.]|nr:ribonuclease P protein component [Lichenihabitans sp.]